MSDFSAFAWAMSEVSVGIMFLDRLPVCCADCTQKKRNRRFPRCKIFLIPLYQVQSPNCFAM
jgi:hypothetical protein